MIKINLAKIRALEVPDKPVETFTKPPVAIVTPTPTIPRSIAKQTLSDQCWAEYNTVRIERAKVSNKIAPLVASGASKEALSELHAEIESYRPELQRLFEVARHVDQYGVLPELKVVQQVPSDIFSLKDQKRKLVDARCKLTKKLKQGSLKDHKVIEWQLELDKANAEFNMVSDQLKKLEGK